MINILHVDDEEAEHLLLRHNLKQISGDLNLLWVSSGKEALEKLESGNFHCLICDYQMPEMDGLELLTNLKSINREIPFIFRTGQGSEQLAAQALRAGASDYYTKGEGFAHYERFYNSIIQHVNAFHQRKKATEAERKIREHEKLLAETQKIARMGSYSLDAKSGIWQSSEVLDEIFGLDEKQVRDTRTWINILHPEDKDEVSDYLLNYVLGGKQPFEKTYRVINQKNKQTRWVKGIGNLTFDESGNVLSMLGTIQDITEEKSAKYELKQTQINLENIFNSSTPICITSKDFEILRANDAYKNIFGDIEKISNGKKCFETRNGDLCHTDRCPVTTILQGADIAFEERKIADKDGNVLWYIASAKPIYDDNKNIVGIIENYQDITKLKQTQFALENSEQRFRAFFEQAPLSYQSLDSEGNFLDVNQTFLETLGYRAEEIIGKSFGNILASEYKQKFRENFPKFKASGAAHNIPFELIKKDGSHILVEVEGRVSYDSEGNFLQTHCIFQDVSSRNKAEESLVDNNLELENIFQTSSPICITDLKCNVVKANSAYQRIFGNITTNNQCKCCPDDCKTPDRPIDQIINGAKIVQHEFQQIDRKGNLRWFSTTSRPYYNQNGTLIGVVENLEEITARIKAEEQLKAREKRFRSYIENSPAAILVVDKNGKYIDANPSAYSLTGYTKKELMHLSIADLSKVDIPEKGLTRTFAELMEKGRISTPMTLIRKDGSQVNVHLDAVKLEGDRYIGFFRDISQEVIAQEALERSEFRFRELFENISSGVAVLRTEDNGESFYIVNMNQTGLKYDNLKKEDIINKKIGDVFPKMKGYGLHEIFTSVYQTGNAQHFPVTLIENNKLISYIENYVYKLPSGEIVAIYTDRTELKAYEKELQHQKFVTEKAQQLGLIGTWQLELSTNHFNWSEETYRILGVATTREPSFRLLEAKIHPQDRDLVFEKWEAALQGSPFDIEHRLLINGDVKWVRQKAEINLDPDGDVTEAIGFMQEITSTKRTELVQQALLRLIDFSVSSDINKLLQKFLDEAEILTDSNVGFFHFVENGREEVSLQTWSTNTLNNMCKAEGEGKHYPIEKAGVWVDCVRQKKPVIHNDYQNLSGKKGLPEGHAEVIRELVVPVFRNDDIVAILGVGNKKTYYTEEDVKIIQRLADSAWEIVIRKKAEIALAQSQQNLEEAQRITSLGSWELDVETGKVLWSDEMYRLFEMEKVTPHLGMIKKRIHPDDHALINQIVESDDSSVFHYRIILPSGKLRHIQSIRKAVHDSSGKLIKMKGTCQDITIRKEAELKTIRANEKLEAANKELEAFSYSVSHDLKSPVRQLASFVNLLQNIASDKLTGEELEILQNIGDSGRKMMTMIEELLKLSRLQKVQLNKEKIDLVEFVNDNLKNLKKLNPERKLNVISPPSLEVEADLKLVSILMQNLIENAWKYSKIREETIIEIGSIQKDGENICFIRDNGVGFNPANSHRLFIPFQRLHSSEVFEGTGIGLATVQRIVNCHGGKIWAESEPDQGATFYFTL